MELREFTDPQLMLMYSHGCEEAFDQLFHRHRKRLYRYLHRMTGDSHEAEEVLQETFVRVARSANTYEATAKFTTWLFRIATNRCLSHLKRRGRFKLLRFPADLSEPEELNPFQQVRDREITEAFKLAVAELESPLRPAFVLRELEGFSYAEGANILNVPVGTMKTHVHRAWKILRLKLSHQLSETECRFTPCLAKKGQR